MSTPKKRESRAQDRRLTRVKFSCNTPLGLKIGTNKLGLTVVTGFHRLPTAVEDGGHVDGPGLVCSCIRENDVLVRVNEDSTYGMDHESVMKRVSLLKGSLQCEDGTISLTFASPAEAQAGMKETDQKNAELAAAAPTIDASPLYAAHLECLREERRQQQQQKRSKTRVLSSKPQDHDEPVVVAPPPKSVLEECQDSLRGDKSIEHLAQIILHSGVPETVGLRSTVWRVLLGYLPLRHRDEWKTMLAAKRSLYFQWCDDLYPKDAHRRRSVADRLESTPKPPAAAAAAATPEEEEEEAVDPLSPELDHAWSEHFSETALLGEIWKDVKRTHNSFSFFSRERDPTIADTLERILFIYAKLNKAVRYVQGMNEVLAPILFCFFQDRVTTSKEKKKEDDEEQLGYDDLKNVEADVFFCFQIIMSHMHDLFITGLDNDVTGLDGTLAAMMEEVRDQNPVLANHLLVDLSLDPKFYGMRWFTTLLAREFDMPDCLRLWDSLFADLCVNHSFDFLIVVCSCIVTSQSNVLMTGDFATAITTLQQPYARADINSLIRMSIERKVERMNPNRKRQYDQNESSLRRERVEKALKNVATASSETMKSVGKNVGGSMKRLLSWASEKKKKRSAEPSITSGTTPGTTAKAAGPAAPSTAVPMFTGAGEGGRDREYQKSTSTKTSANSTPSPLPVTETKVVESPTFVEQKSLFETNKSEGGLFDSDDEDEDEEDGPVSLFGTSKVKKNEDDMRDLLFG